VDDMNINTKAELFKERWCVAHGYVCVAYR